MESDSEAETAIRTLNETVLGGRTLKVNEANERPARQNNRNFNSSRW
jgi:RNA recognition motif-containing protein